MNKKICDICDKREANNNFRVQQQAESGFLLFGFDCIPKMEWVEIDICEECFEKMKTIKDYKKLADRLKEALVGWSNLYDGDVNKQTIYLEGFQTAWNVIDPKHQFKT